MTWSRSMSILQSVKSYQRHNENTGPPAADRVTGHARGCARERACPKPECIWTPK